MLGTIAGCSDTAPKKEYEVPRALCGISLDPELVSPFLPAGHKIKVRETRPVPSRKDCRVDIDKHWALMLNLEWWEDDVSSSMVADGNPRLEDAQLAPDGDFYTGTGAVKLVKGCKSPDHARHLLYTSIMVDDPDLGDTVAMKKLANAFTEAVGKSDACA